MTSARPLCTLKPSLLETGTEAHGCCNNYRNNSHRGSPRVWLVRLPDTSSYLDFGIPHPGSLFGAQGPRGAEKVTLHPRARCPGFQQAAPPTSRTLGGSLFPPAPLRASLPSASLSWARGHELQEQDVEEKIFCCVNTGLCLRWMNSTQASAAVGGV